MSAIDRALGTDFDGRPADMADVLSAGLGDVRRMSRVPELRSILADLSASSHDRFLACIALATWAIEDGYRAVTEACADPGKVEWRGISIDRLFSVDNTFGQLAMAVDSSRWISDASDTEDLRIQALLALVDVADIVYFDGQLEGVVMDDARPGVIEAVDDVVKRGISRLNTDEARSWDLATQLVDITAGIAVKGSKTAVDLTIDIVTAAPSPRTLRHAVDVVARAAPSDTEDLADLLCAVGGQTIAPLVAAAQSRRQRSVG